MPRPPSDLAEQMLQAGRYLIERDGIANLTVRKICTEAGVNLGLFNYYFTTKENFFLQLVLGLRQELAEFVSEGIAAKRDPFAQLQMALDRLIQFMIRHEKLLMAIFYDALLLDDKWLVRIEKLFLKNNYIVAIIEQCLVKNIFKVKMPATEIFYLLFFGIFQSPRMAKKSRQKRRQHYFYERMELILKGLKQK